VVEEKLVSMVAEKNQMKMLDEEQEEQ